MRRTRHHRLPNVGVRSLLTYGIPTSARRSGVQNIILTGVDGSETAAKAAEVAASLATDLKCELYVISAADPNQVELPRFGRLTSESEARNEMAARQNSLDALSRAAQQTAEEAAERLWEKFPNLNITAKSIDRFPAEAILEEAERLDVRFVMVGNKRVQGVGRLLGSVATTVARHIKTDLYIAHTQ